MIKQLAQNWKTTSAGLAMIISSVIHLIFAIQKGTADEATWTTALMGIVGGIGLLAAGDSAVSAKETGEIKQTVAQNTAAIRATPGAIASGDTSLITKAQERVAAGQQDKPPVP